MDSNEAAKHIDDDSLDFIFLDAYLTGEQVKNDLEVWYPKVKTGGIFSDMIGIVKMLRLQ